jgi:hypothetical protein
MENEPILAVYAQYVDRPVLLGYVVATSFDDIAAYYKGKEAYGLSTEVVKPIRIPEGFAEKRKVLEKQREELEKRINAVDKELRLIRDGVNK